MSDTLQNSTEESTVEQTQTPDVSPVDEGVTTPYDFNPVDTTGDLESVIDQLVNIPPAITVDTQQEVFKSRPREPSFTEKVEASFSQFGSISNLMDWDDKWSARRYGSDFEVSDAEMVKGLPEEYHAQVLNEAAEYNEVAGLTMRDQLVDDIANNRIFEDMDWYAQLGYGALATVVDPLSIVPAAAGAKAVQAARVWSASKAVRNTAVVSAWTGGGALEGASMNAPRLVGDHTYTVRDYQMDVLVDAAVGFGLGGLVSGGVLTKNWYTNKKNSDLVTLHQKEEALNQRQLKESAEKYDEPAATPELSEIKTTSNQKEAPAKPHNYTQELGISEETTYTQAKPTTKPHGMKFSQADVERLFVPIGAVDKVSAKGIQTASDATTTVFKPNEPIRKLLNRVTSVNKDKLSPEARTEVDKLNADVIKLLAVVGNKPVPVEINRKVSGLLWQQTEFKSNNALGDVLQGLTADPVGKLQKYVEVLTNKKELWGEPDGDGLVKVPQPVSTEQFYREQSHWLDVAQSVDDDTIKMTQQIPKEISYLKDMVELNKLAAEKSDTKFTELVEQLNGMALQRAKDREAGDLIPFADLTKSYGKEVPMTPPEIAARLKEEGLVPRTPEYRERMQELRKVGTTAVSEEINQLGKLDEVRVGQIVNEASEAPIGLEGTGTAPRVTDLVKDRDEQDLLPRSFAEAKKVDALSDPSVENLKILRNQLRSTVLKPTGVLNPINKKESFAQQAQLIKVRNAVVQSRADTIKRLIKSQNVNNVIDVIRASEQIAATRRKQVVDATPSVKLTEESMDYLDPRITPTVPKTPEEVEEIKEVAASAYEQLVEESAIRWGNALSKFSASGEQEVFKLAMKPKGILDAAGQLAARWTEDLATKFLKNDLTSMNYIGARVTEIGRGFGGAIRRKATGGIIRDHAYRDSIMRIAKPYVDGVEAYAQSKGRNAVQRLFATQRAGADDPTVKEFNRMVFTVQEFRRQGKEVPNYVDGSVIKFVDSWNKYMDHNHSTLVDAGVGGFTKERKVDNYIPHVWMEGKFKTAIKDKGRADVVELLRRAYVSSSANGNNPLTPVQAQEAAEALIDEVLDTEVVKDIYSPVTDSRAKARTDLDTTMEYNGLSVLDLLDDEVIQVATKYSNRMAGWVGLTKSTDGNIKSQLDIDTLKANMVEEGKAKGKDTKTEEQYFDDLMNLMFGRPTRGGLTQELRQLKDLTALTRMGGLGTAQAIETGQVITRGIIQTTSDPKVAEKLYGVARGTPEHKKLSDEIQSLSSLTNDMEWLDRQSVHLDQHELNDVSKARRASLLIADKATWGALKAPASRLLGKTSGFNMVRRIQSRVAQSSFVLDVANHYKHGTGVMGNARMADVGISDVNGNDELLEDAFKNIASWDDDGKLTSLNIEKWPQGPRETLQYALLRDEAQQVMRTQIGELPPWMNRPMMSLVFQFRQMPITAQNKSMSRNLAFADKEAVLGVTLNAALSGLVRYSKFAALGAAAYAVTGEEQPEKPVDLEDTSKYVAQFGMYADAYDLVLGKSGITSMQDATDLGDVIMRQVPVLGLMKDYADTATSAAKLEEDLDAAQGLTPLGNTAYGEVIFDVLEEALEE